MKDKTKSGIPAKEAFRQLMEVIIGEPVIIEEKPVTTEIFVDFEDDGYCD